MPEFDATIRYADVPDFPGYAVGTDGSVWSRKWGRWHRRKTEFDAYGYPMVKLCHNGKLHTIKIHVLIMRSFVGPLPSGMHTCHDNGDKTDCSLNNLRYDTPLMNAADCTRHRRTCRGFRQHKCRLTPEQVSEIRIRRSRGERGIDLANEYGVSTQHICNLFKVRRVVWIS